jgi:hypothetical protein
MFFDVDEYPEVPGEEYAEVEGLEPTVEFEDEPMPGDVDQALNRMDAGEWPDDQQWESSLPPSMLWLDTYVPEPDPPLARDPQIEDYLL